MQVEYICLPKSLNIAFCMIHLLNRAAGKQYLPELLIYMAVWGIVLLFPVVTAVFDLLAGATDALHWGALCRMWRDVSPFLLLFLLNNRVLVPCLFLQQRVAAYVVTAVLLTVLVVMAIGLWDDPFSREQKSMGKALVEREQHLEHEQPSPAFSSPSDVTPAIPPVEFRPDFPQPPAPVFVPPAHGPFIVRTMIALLMLSFNIAVKLFFKSVRDKEAMKELERNQLQTELEYLKYQINPHFFMNTLNNIHALVDIDAEQAKQTLLELSKLMRYMLYEADKSTVPLSKEIQFLRHYVELMRIRYPESVRIRLDLPQEDSVDVQIPPLLFISFVENAFKHGVSYRKDTFISVSLEMEEKELRFRCSNSKLEKEDDGHHGIGLDNIRKRLQLLFGTRYTLSIRDTDRRFEVLLVVPLEVRNV